MTPSPALPQFGEGCLNSWDLKEMKKQNASTNAHETPSEKARLAGDAYHLVVT